MSSLHSSNCKGSTIDVTESKVPNSLHVRRCRKDLSKDFADNSTKLQQLAAFRCRAEITYTVVIIAFVTDHLEL